MTVRYTSAQVYGNGYLNTEGHVSAWPFVFLVTGMGIYMDLLEYLAKTSIVTANIVVGGVVIIFFTTKILLKYTDIGTNKKKEKDKSDRIFNSKSDSDKEEDLGFIYKKPTIETSFGDRRIGEIDGDATQT
jgi:hypothetical protein